MPRCDLPQADPRTGLHGHHRQRQIMYVVLVLAIVAGLYAAALGSGVAGEAYNYRETVSVWFRSIWVLQPRGELMAEAPLYYQMHVLIALVLFALWPFSRLVHAFSAPLGYLFRPYIVYRSREVAAKDDWWARIHGAGAGDGAVSQQGSSVIGARPGTTEREPPAKSPVNFRSGFTFAESADVVCLVTARFSQQRSAGPPV